MKAVVFQEPYKVTVGEMPEPKIEAPNDAVVRMTTTNICGSTRVLIKPGRAA